MQTYKQFSPTKYDSHIELEDREDWLVGPCFINRDSGSLARANWQAFTQEMWNARTTNEDEVDYEEHRFGHWANGWFELVLIKPGSNAAKKALELEDKLDNYPILDEELHSQLQNEEIYEYWKTMSLQERIDLCKKRNVSIFAARKDDSIPDRVYDYIQGRV